jgi:magnesium-transporting ATPase (P-type)
MLTTLKVLEVLAPVVLLLFGLVGGTTGVIVGLFVIYVITALAFVRRYAFPPNSEKVSPSPPAEVNPPENPVSVYPTRWITIVAAFLISPTVAVVVTNSFYYVTGRSWPWSNLINDLLPDLPWFYAACAVSILPVLLLFERLPKAQPYRDSFSWSFTTEVSLWTIISAAYYQITFNESLYPRDLVDNQAASARVFGTVGGAVGGMVYWLIARRPWRKRSRLGTLSTDS